MCKQRTSRGPGQGTPEPTTARQAWQVEHGVPEEHWNNASAIIDPDGNGLRIHFQPVLERKVVKNRGPGHAVPHCGKR